MACRFRSIHGTHVDLRGDPTGRLPHGILTLALLREVPSRSTPFRSPTPACSRGSWWPYTGRGAGQLGSSYPDAVNLDVIWMVIAAMLVIDTRTSAFSSSSRRPTSCRLARRPHRRSSPHEYWYPRRPCPNRDIRGRPGDPRPVFGLPRPARGTSVGQRFAPQVVRDSRRAPPGWPSPAPPCRRCPPWMPWSAGEDGLVVRMSVKEHCGGHIGTLVGWGDRKSDRSAQWELRRFGQ